MANPVRWQDFPPSREPRVAAETPAVPAIFSAPRIGAVRPVQPHIPSLPTFSHLAHVTSSASRRRRLLHRPVMSSNWGPGFDPDVTSLAPSSSSKTSAKRKASGSVSPEIMPLNYDDGSGMEDSVSQNPDLTSDRLFDPPENTRTTATDDKKNAQPSEPTSNRPPLDLPGLSVYDDVIILPPDEDVSGSTPRTRQMYANAAALGWCDRSQVSAAMLFHDPDLENEDAGTALRYLPLVPSLRPSQPKNPFPMTSESFTALSSGVAGANAVPPPVPLSQLPFIPIVGTRLPLEIFENILSYLSRDDAKSMRLVCREFEKKVSSTVFHTALVSFNTELYDMIKPKKTTGNAIRESSDIVEARIRWRNNKEEDWYTGHGLRVFAGFGRHIKRFGMSFEVTEDQLARPPYKELYSLVNSYHGVYQWPLMTYSRFEHLAGLEQMAEEVHLMKEAFSNLKSVRELALSVDNGRGWLNGADQSIRARVFQRSSDVFGVSGKWLPDHQQQEAAAFWDALEGSHVATNPGQALTESVFARKPIGLTLPHLPIASGSIIRYDDPETWPAVQSKRTQPFAPLTKENPVPKDGLLYTTSQQPKNLNEWFAAQDLVPSALTPDQKEWLMETQWAQEAFLDSYLLAVVDNHETFCNVTTLNISKISSSLLPKFTQQSFWDALPALTDITILVKPDWRTIDRRALGEIDAPALIPSTAVDSLCYLLNRHICHLFTVKTLKIGWASGGEHAEGMVARNSNILPAPITQLQHSLTSFPPPTLTFPSVKHLTLTNCWITPLALKSLVSIHSNHNLETLVLDSVSMTADSETCLSKNLPNITPALALAQLATAPAVPILSNWAGLSLFNGQFSNEVNANLHWTEFQRKGSWPDVISTISPGPTLGSYRPSSNDDGGDDEDEEGDTDRPSTNQLRLPPDLTPLHTLEFRSCGYVRLPWPPTFNQSSIASDLHSYSNWFRRRHTALLGHVMLRNDHHCATIIQNIPARELEALRRAWGLLPGWTDAEAATGPEFDGLLRGGTGRFSGVIVKGMSLIDPDEITFPD